MSSASFAQSAGGVLLGAWETEKQVYFGRIDPTNGKVAAPPIGAPGVGQNRKHPAVAANKQGETLLVWTEGTGWQRGGALAWQGFDASGRPTSESGRVAGGIGVWSLATAVARSDGGFTIVH